MAVREDSNCHKAKGNRKITHTISYSSKWTILCAFAVTARSLSSVPAAWVDQSLSPHPRPVSGTTVTWERWVARVRRERQTKPEFPGETLGTGSPMAATWTKLTPQPLAVSRQSYGSPMECSGPGDTKTSQKSIVVSQDSQGDYAPKSSKTL